MSKYKASHGILCLNLAAIALKKFSDNNPLMVASAHSGGQFWFTKSVYLLHLAFEVQTIDSSSAQ
jgi:hypothetical protein